MSTQRRQKSLVFSVENPLIWSGLIENVAKGSYQLADGASSDDRGPSQPLGERPLPPILRNL